MNDELKDLYSTKDSRLDAVASKEKYNYWTMLKEMNSEYTNEKSTLTFVEYIKDKWGIQVHIESVGGGITDQFTVVDEQKYMLAILKFK